MNEDLGVMSVDKKQQEQGFVNEGNLMEDIRFARVNVLCLGDLIKQKFLWNRKGEIYNRKENNGQEPACRLIKLIVLRI